MPLVTGGAAVVGASAVAVCGAEALRGSGCFRRRRERGRRRCGSSGPEGGQGRKAASLLIPRHPNRAVGSARARPLLYERQQQFPQSRRWWSAELPAQPAQLAAGRAWGRLRAAQGTAGRRGSVGGGGSQKGPGAVKREGGAGEAPMLLPNTPQYEYYLYSSGMPNQITRTTCLFVRIMNTYFR